MDRSLSAARAAALVLLLALLLASALAAPTAAQQQPTPSEQAVLKTWIDPNCCVTSAALPAGTGCCFEIDPSAVVELGGGRFRVAATGQVVQARPSRDGKWWRCACDPLPGGGWLVHDKADTRCLYVFMGS